MPHHAYLRHRLKSILMPIRHEICLSLDDNFPQHAVRNGFMLAISTFIPIVLTIWLDCMLLFFASTIHTLEFTTVIALSHKWCASALPKQKIPRLTWNGRRKTI